MDNSLLVTQLRALVEEYRGRANDIEKAADLQETGYKADQVRIDAEIQKGKDEAMIVKQGIIDDLSKQIELLKNPA